MKILLLSDCNSVHTIKWATALSKKNISVVIFSLGKLEVSDYEGTNVNIIDHNISTTKQETLQKIKYLSVVPSLKRTIRKEAPDIVHAHYATSYGLLGAASGFSPLILSVWGSDVFEFPKKSFFHKAILKHNLKKAEKILSTSHVMAKETKLYTDKNIEVTPFGIDLQTFKPHQVKSLFENKDIVVGTIKTLEEKYGLEFLIRAFKVVCDKHIDLPLKLLIVGAGSLEGKLKALTRQLNIESKTIFTGKVPFIDVPKYHNMLSVSVSVSVSNSESFGVAIIEASACETPVVVSNVGGLPEVVENMVTGIVVPPKDVEQTARAIEQLVTNKALRKTMGMAGRVRVMKEYNWDNNVAQMINIYKNVQT